MTPGLVEQLTLFERTIVTLIVPTTLYYHYYTNLTVYYFNPSTPQKKKELFRLWVYVEYYCGILDSRQVSGFVGG